MNIKGLLFVLAMTPIMTGAQTLVADPNNSAAVLQSLNQQQAYFFEAQQAQQAQLAKQQELQAKAAQRGLLVNGIFGLCAQMFGNLQNTASDIRSAAYDANEAAGYKSDSAYGSYAGDYGAAGAAVHAKGCERFMNAAGEEGPWGRTTRAAMSEYPVFSDPSIDVSAICPNFPNFDQEQRNNFWVWMFKSMASKESGCNSGAKAQGVNATAVGLFQLHSDQCPPFNMLDGDANITCAVRMLAKEISGRRKLVSRCSTSGDCAKEENGQAEATYWAVLRVDGAPDDPKKGSPKDETVARQKEIQSGYESRKLMAKAPGCND